MIPIPVREQTLPENLEHTVSYLRDNEGRVRVRVAFGSKVRTPNEARNAAAGRVLERADIVREGLLRRDRMKWPEWRDMNLFGLLAEQCRGGGSAETG